MAPKRPLETDSGTGSKPESKKPRHGFRVGPENLPDGPWRRKMTKDKKELIHKTKVKKAYARIKAREFPEDPKAPDAAEAAAPQIHPERVAMLEAGDTADAAPEPPAARNGEDGRPPHQEERRRGRGRRPGYFDKQLREAGERQAAAEARQREREEREEEKGRKTADRARRRKAQNKARAGAGNGQRKLGRESKLLLERVKKMVGK